METTTSRQPIQPSRAIQQMIQSNTRPIENENQEINKIRLETPTRLEMNLPYQEPIKQIYPESQEQKYLPNQISNSVSNSDSNSVSNSDSNPSSKIRQIIKKCAEMSFLALDGGKEPISALKSSNYAVAYLSALQEFYTQNQIENSTNINLPKFKDEIIKIQNKIVSNVKKNCSFQESDKEYLLNVINKL